MIWVVEGIRSPKPSSATLAPLSIFAYDVIMDKGGKMTENAVFTVKTGTYDKANLVSCQKTVNNFSEEKCILMTSIPDDVIMAFMGVND